MANTDKKNAEKKALSKLLSDNASSISVLEDDSSRGFNPKKKTNRNKNPENEDIGVDQDKRQDILMMRMSRIEQQMQLMMDELKSMRKSIDLIVLSTKTVQSKEYKSKMDRYEPFPEC